MVVNRHLMAYGIDSKDADNGIIGWYGLPITVSGSPCAFLVHHPSQPMIIPYDPKILSHLSVSIDKRIIGPNIHHVIVILYHKNTASTLCDRRHVMGGALTCPAYFTKRLHQSAEQEPRMQRILENIIPQFASVSIPLTTLLP
jgi:hypothetical protein